MSKRDDAVWSGPFSSPAKPRPHPAALQAWAQRSAVLRDTPRDRLLPATERIARECQ